MAKASSSYLLRTEGGVGKVYQLTAIDVFTRWAIVMIVLGPVTQSQRRL